MKFKLTHLLLSLLFVLSITTSFAKEYPIMITPEGHIVVEVTLQDSVKGNFILDTGAGLIVLSSKMFEKVKESSQNAGFITGFRSDGDRLDGELYSISSIAVGEEIKEDVKVAVYPPLDNYGVDGLLSLKFFEDKPFSIDFQNNKIRFLEEKECNKLAENNRILPISISSHTDTSLDIFVRVCLNDEVSINAEFDTGSGYNTFLINTYFEKNLNIDTSSVKVRPFKRPISQTEVQDKIVQLNTISLCKDEKRSIEKPTVVFREGLIYEGLIGSSFFKNSKLTIDILNKRMIIQD
ncbi:aspartyl protease family protein [Bernardetia sp. OM2101]|uniref:aspartyl protease family protein n=1 Tax=Bernardetia sp. OM2101 TaxID=3344876 RepID=UPI0035D0AE0B